jgi:hypothetical protein
MEHNGQFRYGVQARAGSDAGRILQGDQRGHRSAFASVSEREAAIAVRIASTIVPLSTISAEP